MSQGLEISTDTFVDRRNEQIGLPPAAGDRRQFGNSHEDLSPDARELAEAIDQYKVHHRRRFLSFEEILAVIESLGYHR